VADRHRLPDDATQKILDLLLALEREPDPHTTVAEPALALDRHISDSLSGLEVPGLREADRIADIGAGAGFPGLALAVANQAAEVHLIESARRKAAVIDRLAAAAAIGNARAVNARAEEWAAREGAAAYDAVTARALAALPVLVEYAAPLLRVDGVLVAWKGSRDPDEEAAGEAAAALVGLERSDMLSVRPFRGSQVRHLYVYSKAEPTPDRFPRRPGMATKRPLA
jgi:16S rRNA (guanine527-N7)-methyltransferase